MHQAVDAFFHFDERAEIGQLAYAPFNDGADGVTLRHGGPGIGLQLLDTERDAAVLRLHIEHYGFYLVADFDHFARMLHAPAPGHFGDVDQPLDAGLQLDKSAVVGDADDASHDARAHGVIDRNRFPRIGQQLFQPE